jgi:hypothetical protein
LLKYPSLNDMPASAVDGYISPSVPKQAFFCLPTANFSEC